MDQPLVPGVFDTVLQSPSQFPHLILENLWIMVNNFRNSEKFLCLCVFSCLYLRYHSCLSQHFHCHNQYRCYHHYHCCFCYHCCLANAITFASSVASTTNVALTIFVASATSVASTSTLPLLDLLIAPLQISTAV